MEDSSVFDWYYNPFDVKDGIDLNPDFKPDPHNQQLKSLCDEAVFRIYAKSPISFKIIKAKGSLSFNCIIAPKKISYIPNIKNYFFLIITWFLLNVLHTFCKVISPIEPGGLII